MYTHKLNYIIILLHMYIHMYNTYKVDFHEHTYYFYKHRWVELSLIPHIDFEWLKSRNLLVHCYTGRFYVDSKCGVRICGLLVFLPHTKSVVVCKTTKLSSTIYRCALSWNANKARMCSELTVVHLCVCRGVAMGGFQLPRNPPSSSQKWAEDRRSIP